MKTIMNVLGWVAVTVMFFALGFGMMIAVAAA